MQAFHSLMQACGANNFSHLEIFAGIFAAAVCNPLLIL